MKLRNHWLSKGIIAAFAGVSFFFTGPAMALAASCECFCGDSFFGAFSVNTYDSQNECAQACSDGDVLYVGCYIDEALYPENSNLCWTEDQCTSYPIDVGGEKKYGKWGGQSPYCAKEKVTNAEMGYCHGPLIPVTLNVPILGLTEVYDLGTYVNTVYRYAIPVSGIFGVLMMTIAGFQYMTAGGNKGAVGKAKDRMANSAIAIVLLMSVYTIAYLIDPRFTRFNELRPPLIKEAILLSDATSCESLFSYGYCIDGTCPDPEFGESLNMGECGKQGTITGEIERVNTVVNPPKIGDSCAFSGCSNGEACIVDPAQKNGVCVTCAEVSTGNSALALKPSPQVCSEIAQSMKRNSGSRDRDDRKFICEYDDDGIGALLRSGSMSTVGLSECVSFYSENKEYVDCAAMRERAKSAEDGCSLYENLNADTFVSSGITSGIYSALQEAAGSGSADTIEDVKEHFANICAQDICGIADSGEIKQGSCSFKDTNIVEDFVDAVPIASYFFADNYGCVGAVSASGESETGSSGYEPMEYGR